ncbi:MAG: cupin domain-containing protein [Spirochaetaceae bacterium]|jgi:mannose-6-phosphate isomerase-like protein (cupin superfamily)|nr:cupin domain-containing protein [Spirochaetaceae bacterium]
MDKKVIRYNDTKNLLEGDEFTKVYVHTDKLIFATSTLLPGQKACLDKGHIGADEICYVIEGQVAIHLTGLDEVHELGKGDCILIPDGEPHYTVNIGDIKSVTAWACAPHL